MELETKYQGGRGRTKKISENRGGPKKRQKTKRPGVRCSGRCPASKRGRSRGKGGSAGGGKKTIDPTKKRGGNEHSSTSRENCKHLLLWRSNGLMGGGGARGGRGVGKKKKKGFGGGGLNAGCPLSLHTKEKKKNDFRKKTW